MTDSHVIEQVTLARSVEASGHYNLSKLLWALAYSEAIAASNRAGLLHGADLQRALADTIADLTAQGAPDALIAALQQGADGLRAEQHEYLPPVFVSRTTGDIFVGDRPADIPTGEDPLDLREFSPIYYFEPLPPADIIEALRTYPHTLTMMIEGLNDDQLTAVPFPGEWSIKDLLMHLDVAQGLLLSRSRQILSEDNPVLQGVSAWLLTDSSASPRDILSHYLDIRAQIVGLLAPLPAADWWRPARHNEFGPLTLHAQASYFTRHERAHRQQLAQLVQAVSS